MSKQRVYQMIIRGIKQFRDPYYQGFAAQIAFFFLLSLVPIIILLSQLLAVFSISLNTLTEWIAEYISGDVAEILYNLISYTPGSAMNLLFALIALWAASRAQFAMMRITNYTFSEGRSTGKGYFRERMRAVKTMIFMLFTVAFALIILVYGELLLQLIVTVVTRDTYNDYTANQIWLKLRWVIALILYFLMVAYTYYVMPSEKMSFRDILPGSIFASVGMLIVTFFYTLYTNFVARYDILYGSLASVVALMFWFYFLAWALGLGVLCNKVFLDTKGTVPRRR